jgi:hypothetical protein
MCKFIILFVNKDPEIANIQGKMMTTNYYDYKPQCFDTLIEAETMVNELKENNLFTDYYFEIKNIENCNC